MSIPVLAGCSRTPKEGSEQAAKAARIKAYVRIDALETTHPLYSDLDRLARAESDLRRAAAAGAARPVGSGEELALPALTPGVEKSAPAEAAALARETRRTSARAELQSSFDARMESFLAERARRQKRLVDQRRDELTALNMIRVAERERLARDAVYAETRLALQAKVGDTTHLQAGLGVLNAQLDPTALQTWYSAPLEPLELEWQINRLEAGTDTYDLSMQSLLELKRRNLATQLGSTKDDLAEIKRSGLEQANAAAQKVSELNQQEIEAELEPLNDDEETRFIARAQDDARKRALATDAALTDRAAQERLQLLGGAAGTASGPIHLGEVFPAGPGVIDPTGARLAADRVAGERIRLRRFIRADVTDTVRDVAQRRNLDVVLIAADDQSAATAAKETRLAGRRDMTGQFARWMQPGAGAGMPALGSAPARSRK